MDKELLGENYNADNSETESMSGSSSENDSVQSKPKKEPEKYSLNFEINRVKEKPKAGTLEVKRPKRRRFKSG